jgi:hypothetical protein
VLSKNFIVPSISQGEPTELLRNLNLNYHLQKIPWTLELGHAFDRFSLPTYLDWLDQRNLDDIYFWMRIDQLPEHVLIYLNNKVSNLCSQNQVSAAASHIDQGQSNLYYHHLLCYQEHLMSFINHPPSSRVKFDLMSTVWFVLQEPFASLWGDDFVSWEILCTTLFGFSAQELNLDEKVHSSDCKLMCHPTEYKDARQWAGHFDVSNLIYRDLSTTKRLIPEPILSLRLALVAISCMRYLRHQDPKTSLMQHHLLAWARKSKRLPWLWRRRMQFTSIRCRKPTCWRRYRPKSSIPQSLRQSRQIFFSKAIQSEDFYLEKEIFYIWTLDLLYLTLRTAMKSDELTKALSKPFIRIIPSVALLLFPRQIKRVKEAIEAYLEKVSQRASF